MAKSKQIEDELSALLEDIEAYAELGDNAVVRRIRSRIYEFVKSNSSITPKRPERPCENGPLSLLDVVDEYQADDRRRSVFVDPEEAVIANLTDFHSGRLKSVEFRDPHGKLDFLQLHIDTIQTMRNIYPVVTINESLARNSSEISFLLRSMAEDFDKLSINLKESCTTRTESLGTRWTNNGTTLERGYRVVEKCCNARDPCCGNQTCGERTVSGGWDVIWNDGNSTNPPPLNPDPYQPSPWNNRLPFFDDANIGRFESDWGWRTLNGITDFHGGIDVSAPVGTPVRSVDTGVVVALPNSGHNSGVVIRSGQTTYTYFHITPNPQLGINTPISVGTNLGNIAPGGRAHLHYSHHLPPNGNPAQRDDANSQNPLP